MKYFFGVFLTKPKIPMKVYIVVFGGNAPKISQKFYRQFGFPGVYDALDCSLIKIRSPGGSLAKTFRCRKGFFALNVQAVSDPNLSIRNIVVRWLGSTHNSTVLTTLTSGTFVQKQGYQVVTT
ncbi:nuclease HARBI1 [Trichonephila inaurata madagascariensis]|uniref:Nuclease HARBI1 n=1 Tax=Trichonephila inaurata madagascariensis TaxID=2747483 RepID=A0A8X7CQC8_9ARAC|nr:nuclease HARBI1 [Trichonephila inaurata madagascariensis]